MPRRRCRQTERRQGEGMQTDRTAGRRFILIKYTERQEGDAGPRVEGVDEPFQQEISADTIQNAAFGH